MDDQAIQNMPAELLNPEHLKDEVPAKRRSIRKKVKEGQNFLDTTQKIPAGQRAKNSSKLIRSKLTFLFSRNQIVLVFLPDLLSIYYRDPGPIRSAKLSDRRKIIFWSLKADLF